MCSGAHYCRLSADWKIEIGINGSGAKDRFELNDSTTFVNNVRSLSGRGLLEKSLGEHWSAGVKWDANYSGFSPQPLRVPRK